jgi:hypothetical protein
MIQRQNKMGMAVVVVVGSGNIHFKTSNGAASHCNGQISFPLALLWKEKRFIDKFLVNFANNILESSSIANTFKPQFIPQC